MMRFENEGRLLIQPAFVILVSFLEKYYRVMVVSSEREFGDIHPFLWLLGSRIFTQPK